MNRLNYLPLPAYLVAFIVAAFALLETALTVWPLRLGDVAWRFGTAGLFSRALMSPLLALLIVFAVALLAGHRWVLRAISIVSGALAVAIVCVSGLFVLDALQMRVRVPPGGVFAFDVASAIALGKYGFSLVALAVVAVFGWKASRSIAPPHQSLKSSEDVLVMGRNPKPPAPSAPPVRVKA